jgi:hypothetical protein
MVCISDEIRDEIGAITASQQHARDAVKCRPRRWCNFGAKTPARHVGVSDILATSAGDVAMPQHSSNKTDTPPVEIDWIWGAEAIGREIGRDVNQVYYMFSAGQFRGAVWKMGLKTMVASRTKLRELAEQLASETS